MVTPALSMTDPGRAFRPIRPWAGGCLGAVVVLAAMVPQAAFAIVETAGTVSAGTGVNVAVVNVTHSVPAGTDRYLLVGVSRNGGGSGGNVTSVVWNDGTATQTLTQLGTVNNSARRASIFGLVAPEDRHLLDIYNLIGDPATIVK